MSFNDVVQGILELLSCQTLRRRVIILRDLCKECQYGDPQGQDEYASFHKLFFSKIAAKVRINFKHLTTGHVGREGGEKSQETGDRREEARAKSQESRDKMVMGRDVFS
jgi:hypothetical protein